MATAFVVDAMAARTKPSARASDAAQFARVARQDVATPATRNDAVLANAPNATK
jgi:Asp-tRNA(Asn)/Glu-tRNA(Gln) amidotransferase C subunit